MASEPKKPDVVDEYVRKGASDLMNEFYDLNKHKKKKAREDEQLKHESRLDSIVDKFFIEHHGKDNESGRAKENKIKDGNSKEMAQELLDRIALYSIEKKLGKEAAKAYKGNHQMLRAYASSIFGERYENIVAQMERNTDIDITRTELYQNLKQAAAGSAVKENDKLQHLQYHITSRENDEGFLDDIKSAFSKKTGRDPKAYVRAPEILSHYAAHAESGVFTEPYLHRNEKRFKKLKKD